jgi:hypothetical protein
LPPMRRAWAGTAILCLALASCQRSDAPDPAYAVTSSAAPASSGCTALAGKADRRCTPGATDPAVTQADITTTICVRGWTATVRPPASYTTALKRQQMIAYSETGPVSSYEEDHLIPLELGGAPRDPHNLWPQLWNGAQGAHTKDQTENALHHSVCSGAMRLADAQARMAQQWTH